MLFKTLDQRLTLLKSFVGSMGGHVEEMLKEVFSIYFDKDMNKSEILEKIEEHEKEINNLQIKLDKYCFRILARQGPVAKDLRMILSIITINISLERIGDLILNIAKKGMNLDKDPLLDHSLNDLKEMFYQAISMVNDCLDSFINEDSELAKKIILSDSKIDNLNSLIHKKLKECIFRNNKLIGQCIDLVSVCEKLERIGDQTTNIAEEIIFLKTGRDIKHQKGIEDKKS